MNKLSDDVKRFPPTSTRKDTELLVEPLTLRYDPIGNLPRCQSIQ